MLNNLNMVKWKINRRIIKVDKKFLIIQSNIKSDSEKTE